MMPREQQFEDILQRCLERMEHGATLDACVREYPTHAEELTHLLQAAMDVRAWSIPQQRAAKRHAVHARARAAFVAGQQAPQMLALLQPRLRRASWLVLRYAGAFAFMLALLGTTVAAAQDDIPGDMLYSVKLGSEQVRLGLARTPDARANLYLTYAQRRLDECVALSRLERNADASLLAIQNEYANALEAIHAVPPDERAALVQRYQQDVAAQQQTLTTALNMDVPPGARSSLEQALETIRQAQSRLGTLDGAPAPHPTPPEVQQTPTVAVASTATPDVTKTPLGVGTASTSLVPEGTPTPTARRVERTPPRAPTQERGEATPTGQRAKGTAVRSPTTDAERGATRTATPTRVKRSSASPTSERSTAANATAGETTTVTKSPTAEARPLVSTTRSPTATPDAEPTAESEKGTAETSDE